ncbi:hypothetical protein B4900_03995 [Yersinia rohdei]|nr:hypothetical protein B4900_03995 [Yersinia rohdei]
MKFLGINYAKDKVIQKVQPAFTCGAPFLLLSRAQLFLAVNYLRQPISQLSGYTVDNLLFVIWLRQFP